MKKNIIYSAALSTLALASCSGFLDENPLSNVTDKNYYKTEADAVGSVNAIYESMGIGSVAFWQGTGNGNTTYGGIFYNDYWLIQDVFSDNATHDDWRYTNFDNFSLAETDGQIKTLWYNFYRSINTINVAVDRIPLISMDAVKRSHLVAEARFWRGLLYGELAKLWGDVPLRLHASQGVDELYGETRADRIKVLDAALEDLKFAIDNLQPNYRQGAGRASVLMANAVAAKVSLIKAACTRDAADYQDVADYAYEVIKTNKYSLYPNYADNFVIAKKHGVESVVSINYGGDDLWRSQFNVALLPAEIRANSPSGKEGPDNANSWIVPSSDLFDSFKEGDKRRDVAIMKDFTYSDGSVLVFEESAKYPYYWNKYWDRKAEPEGKNSLQNYPFMRYSEVLLMYAEALNEVNNGPTKEAYDAINKVRARAYGDINSTAYDLSGLDQTQFRKAILDERRWELALEGSRWFDLVRLAPDFSTTIKAVKPGSYAADKHKLFPIPQYERKLNSKITQNAGY